MTHSEKVGPETREPGCLAGIAFLMSLLAPAILTFAARHAHVDSSRPHREITWLEPVGSHSHWFLLLGWGTAGLALVTGIVSLSQFCGRLRHLGLIAIALSSVTLIGSCLFFGAVFED